MKGKKYDIVLIRHAQSLFNEATQKAAAQLSLQHLGWDELIEHPEFNKLVTYNKQYMDPSLSEKGRIQVLWSLSSVKQMFKNALVFALISSSSLLIEEPSKLAVCFSIMNPPMLLSSPYFHRSSAFPVMSPIFGKKTRKCFLIIILTKCKNSEMTGISKI